MSGFWDNLCFYGRVIKIACADLLRRMIGGV